MSGMLFDGRSLEQKLQDARKFLEENGYIVRGPLTIKTSLKNSADLVKFFYDKMAQYNPNLLLMYAGSRKRDLDIAKKFIQSRIDLGMSTSRAILECATLIEVLFRHEERLGLNFKITSMSVLGQESMAWLTERLVDLSNGFNRELEEAKAQAWFNDLYEYQENNVPDELVKQANKRLGLEDEDGKKEE